MLVHIPHFRQSFQRLRQFRFGNGMRQRQRTSLRRKQDYDMTKNSNGKVVVEKAGLKEVTRDGWEYELTINLELDMRHLARAGKDRTGLFMDKPEFVPSVETGRMIKDWCERGEDAPLAGALPLPCGGVLVYSLF